MAIKYIGTPDIKVFPSAFRNDDEAKRTTEENLIKFNRLSSFSDNLEQMFIDPDDSDYIIFNIHGYWFRCLITKIPIGNNLFAYIKLEKVVGVGWKLSAIDGGALDAGTDFKGLSFTSNSSDIPSGNATTKYYSLQVTNNTGELNYQKLKLDSTEIRNDGSTKSISEEFNTGKINGVSIKSVGSDVEITGPSNEIISFPADKYGEVAFMGDIPEAIKNPHLLTIKRNNTTLGTYDGSSAKVINITDENTTYSEMALVEGQVGKSLTPRTINAATLKSLIQYHRQWTYLGTARHDDIVSAASFPETAGDFSEYMVIYTNSIDGKYTDMTEVVYGPVGLLDGMTLPGYEYSTITCTSSYITIDWWDFGSGVETKTYIIVYGK